MLGQMSFDEIARSIDRFRAMRPYPGLRDFVAAIPLKLDKNPDRRRAPRQSLVADVTGVPLDAECRPISPPFIACCRNISTGGICLYHHSPSPSELLYIEIEETDLPPMQAIMKVLRQRRVGQFWEIAGEFREEDGGPREAE